MQCVGRPSKRRRSEIADRINHWKNSPPCPEAATDLGAWPRLYIGELEKSGNLENIINLLKDGGIAATDYSGLDALAVGWVAHSQRFARRVRVEAAMGDAWLGEIVRQR